MEQKFSKNDAEIGMIENEKHMKGFINKYFEWNFSKFPFEKQKNILDFGCGPCAYFNQMMRLEPKLYYATDYSDYYAGQVRTLFDGRSNCRISVIDLLDEKSFEVLYDYEFDFSMCFDVLEHIEYDLEALKNMGKIIRKTGNGTLFIKVPALQAIYGENDKSIGHYRRYSKKSLTKLVNDAGFRILDIHYHNIFGIVPWWIIGRVLKRKIALSSNEGSLFDNIVPVFKFLENIITPPLGLSLNCVCKCE